MKNDTYLYQGSVKEARREEEGALWRASHQANIACKKAIEHSIQQNYDGMHLSADCLGPVLEEWGFKRTAWVLANTIREKNWDGRFRPDNRQWADHISVPPDPEHNCAFVVGSHPEVLDGFVSMYRQSFQKLGLFGPEQCEPNSFSELDYQGKVLILSLNILKESCWTQENQLWLAHDGFGCSPHAIGRSIRCTCLGDGETTRWNRADFIGVMQDRFIPDWARERMTRLQAPEQEAASKSGGMTMQ